MTYVPTEVVRPGEERIRERSKVGLTGRSVTCVSNKSVKIGRTGKIAGGVGDVRLVSAKSLFDPRLRRQRREHCIVLLFLRKK